MNEAPKSKPSFQSTSKRIFKKIQKDEQRSKRGAIKFDWNNKWLKGDEYAYILKNINTYCKKFNFSKYPNKTHPSSIYTEPQSKYLLLKMEIHETIVIKDGTIYFVEGNTVGSEFGFPRVDVKKKYRWKKMNFTTDLPKKNPLVTYIVASAVKCEKFFPNSKNEGPSFRMHAVILSKNGAQSKRNNQKISLLKLEKDIKLHSKESAISIPSHRSLSLKSEDSERNGFNLNRDALTEEAKEHFIPQKNYILCHIRKIDQNYKTSKLDGEKRREAYDVENEIEGGVIRKRKKSAQKEQINILSKSTSVSNTETNFAFDNFRRRHYTGSEDSNPFRSSFSMVVPDANSRMSYDTENTNTVPFSIAVGNFTSLNLVPKVNFQNLKGNSNEFGYHAKESIENHQRGAGMLRMSKEKQSGYEQSTQKQALQFEKPVSLGKVDSILSKGLQEYSNGKDCDYIKLFNMLNKGSN